MDAGAREPVLQQLLLSVAMVLLVVNAQTTGCDTVSPYTINRVRVVKYGVMTVSLVAFLCFLDRHCRWSQSHVQHLCARRLLH